MNGKLGMLALLVAMFAVVGCGDPEPDVALNDVGPEVDADGDVGPDAEEDVEEDADVCVPIAECTDALCGDVDDGCGGTLECEPCACDDGQAVETSCGGCGLGEVVCDEGETGPGVCETPDIPGWDEEDCEQLVFVSPEGSATGLGTLDDPVDSLQDGIDIAVSNGSAGVIVAGGSSARYAGPVVLEQALSLVGGYTSDFVRNVSNRPVVESSEENGKTVGLSIEDVAGPVVISRISFETADAESEATSNYAIRVKNSPGVVLSYVQGVAGKGGDGSHGQGGENNAANGEPGESAPVFYDGQGNPGAPGGENESCPDANGGAGGGGAYSLQSGEVRSGRTGMPGRDAAGGSGGVPVGSGRPGEDGADGPSIPVPGANGEPGSSIGEIVDGWWMSLGSGVDGEPGTAGSGGGGGGGAAGESEFDIGSAGGGGGAGGCGGEAGAGGSGGGGSFGLFVISSDIVVERSSFFADLGGRGGDGGRGVPGGEGAEGGAPALMWGDQLGEYNFTYLGGYGGDGANGSAGGHGGGGAGGVSYGAYCVESELNQVGSVRFAGGGSAPGGVSRGFSGDEGTSADMFQCD